MQQIHSVQVSPSVPRVARRSLDETRAPVAQPVPRALIERELARARFLRRANKSGSELYVVDTQSAPSVVYEIGRLRELTFREAGGGTGAEVDLDEHDVRPGGYQQLLVWDPHEREIVGGYRFIHGARALEHGGQALATAELFDFSPTFLREVLPRTIELGRSFIQPKYQAGGNSSLGVFALDNLWDGLGTLVVDHPDVAWFFGKVTTYRSMHALARQLVLGYLARYFPDPERLVRPHVPSALPALPAEFDGLDAKAALKRVRERLREVGSSVPPLIQAYMGLSSTMKSFGTSVNRAFGNTEETGILITIADIFPAKLERHTRGYAAKAGPSGLVAL